MNNRKYKYSNVPKPEHRNEENIPKPGSEKIVFEEGPQNGNSNNNNMDKKEYNPNRLFTMIRKSGSSDKFIVERKAAADSAMYYGNVIRFIGSSVRQNRNLNFVNYSNFMPTKKIVENLERDPVRRTGKSRGN